MTAKRLDKVLDTIDIVFGYTTPEIEAAIPRAKALEAFWEATESGDIVHVMEITRALREMDKEGG